MFEVSEKIVNEEIKELEYSGFESDTFYNTESEFYQEAFDQVKYNSIERLRDKLLDQASIQLDASPEGNFLWGIIYNNIDEQVALMIGAVMNQYK